MKPGMDRALRTLETLLEADEITAGLDVRVHGDHLILARDVELDDGEMVSEDRVRLTRLSANRWGLSVKRHTGRWQRTPFMGSIEEIVDVMHSFMQHLVAPY
jgi:hypothetical protein